MNEVSEDINLQARASLHYAEIDFSGDLPRELEKLLEKTRFRKEIKESRNVAQIKAAVGKLVNFEAQNPGQIVVISLSKAFRKSFEECMGTLSTSYKEAAMPTAQDKYQRLQPVLPAELLPSPGPSK